MMINVRHNGFRVDMTGMEDNVNAAMGALNAHADLLAACERWMSASADDADMDAAYVQQCREITRAAIEKARAS